jgi:hypothetical protein
VGDRILFGKYAGQEIKLDGEEYFTTRRVIALTVEEAKRVKISLAVVEGMQSIGATSRRIW